MKSLQELLSEVASIVNDADKTVADLNQHIRTIDQAVLTEELDDQDIPFGDDPRMRPCGDVCPF